MGEKKADTMKWSFTPSEIESTLQQLKGKRVLVIGDTIIDQYVFAEQKGRAVKDPILSVEYVGYEMYAGGIFAIANHVSDFVKSVEVVTLVGERKSREDFLQKSVPDNVSIKFFQKPDAPTTVKKRYIDTHRNNKLFKVEYINDKPISAALSEEIVAYVKKAAANVDVVIVGDFGHGFLNDEIRSVLQDVSPYLCLNVQSNSANMGFNYVNHYAAADFVSLNEFEIRLPLMKRFDDLSLVMKEFNDKYQFDNFLVTTGRKGSMMMQDDKISNCPIMIDTVVDTVGSGDALFAIASLFSYAGASGDMITFVGNVAGGINANYLGNKGSVKSDVLMKHVREMLR